MSLKRTALGVAPLCALLVLTMATEPALAAGSHVIALDSGEAFAKLLKGWAQWLIPAVVALTGIPAIARHDFGMAISIFIVAMLLGSFAYMTADDFKTVVTPVIHSLTGKP
jgi:hypothetical protein